MNYKAASNLLAKITVSVDLTRIKIQVPYPGSVFKMFTCASALEEEVVSLDSTFECSGIADVAGTKIRCPKAQSLIL